MSVRAICRTSMDSVCFEVGGIDPRAAGPKTKRCSLKYQVCQVTLQCVKLPLQPPDLSQETLPKP